MGAASYHTLSAGVEVTGEFEDRRSRFIAQLVHVGSEAEAEAHIAAVRARHHDARHNVPAWILADGRERCSDDGEPSRTSGMPTLDVLKGAGLADVCCVVTRYFGGILLGAGGLVRAYSQGAATAINAAGVGEVSPTRRYLMEVPYPMLGRVEYLLKSLPVIVEDKQFSDAIVMTLIVRARDDEAFLSAVTSGTDGRIEPIFMEEMYKAWTE